jgi:hypothetical protein
VTRPAWLPSPDGELLLLAALGEGDVAERAWARWRAAHIEDQFDIASFRLLPLVYRNLAAAGSEDPYMGRLKGLYRRSWFVTQSLARSAAAAVARLERAGIPTMLLKGAGLAVAHYRDLGARPMDDVDIAVPSARAADALELLGAAGYRPRRPIADGQLLMGHAVPLAGADGTVIDLHSSTFWAAGGDDELWEASVPVELHGVGTRTLCPADHILHVCTHGAYWSGIHPLRWVADVHAVARSGGVDWDRLVRLAHERELGDPLAGALEYVHERFGVSTAPDLPARLRAGRVRPLRRAAQRVAALPPSRLRSSGLLFVYLDAYGQRARAAGFRPTPRGFLRWLERHLQVAGTRELAFRIAESLARRPGAMPVVAPRP